MSDGGEAYMSKPYQTPYCVELKRCRISESVSLSYVLVSSSVCSHVVINDFSYVEWSFRFRSSRQQLLRLQVKKKKVTSEKREPSISDMC